MWNTLRETVSQFIEDECPRMAAALAYYAVFALPAMMVVIISIAALFVDRGQATDEFLGQVKEATGERTAEMLGTVLEQTQQPEGNSWRWIVGVGVLLFAATGMLNELQTALNRAWGVQPDPNVGTVRSFFVKRLISLALLLAITLLLLLSLAMSWFLSQFGTRLTQFAPAWLSENLMWAANELITVVTFTLLFAAIFKILPDANLAWSDVWGGALFTAVLFMLGKLAISYYFSWSEPATAYGAAGSLALVLLWVYYSAMILFLGAEFTQVWSRHKGRKIAPADGAAPSPSRRMMSAG